MHSGAAQVAKYQLELAWEQAGSMWKAWPAGAIQVNVGFDTTQPRKNHNLSQSSLENSHATTG